MPKLLHRFLCWVTGAPTLQELEQIEFNAFANVLRKAGLSELTIRELWIKQHAKG